MNARAAVLLAMLSAPAGPAAAQDAGLADPLRRHAQCADAGGDSAVCAGILAGHRLDIAEDLRGLTACRAALAAGLEAQAAALAARLRALGAGPTATGLRAGADRTAARFCSAPSGRPAGHAARCALMRAHLEVCHLRRALIETEHET
ncbi:hypothetical protein [Halovulum marinum]|uniref:hypothetical protein n=1 Tax=Halovulum marinum TaxID=2662447 RepID=UPI001F1EFBA9|nr:hypothetical protein [Halovulum marinum]